MGIVTGTFTRYGAVGLREQLANVIYDISPMDTPILSGAAKGEAKQTLFEWQTDSLDSATTANAHLEGDDITAFPSVSPTARVGNYTQISRKLLILSGTLEAVDKAGRQSELAYQMAKRGREIKRDMESVILANLGGNAGGTATPRQTATLGAWLKSNVDATNASNNPQYTSGVPGAPRTDAALRTLTETIFKNTIQQVWESGGNVDALFAFPGPVNKQRISLFTGVVTRNFDISNASPRPTAVIAAADVYVTDFGTVRIVPQRFGRERDLYFIDFEYVGINTLRPFNTVKLAKTGDAEKRMLLVEWGLKIKNEAALGLAADLTTT
jgi:hypothetical protein